MVDQVDSDDHHPQQFEMGKKGRRPKSQDLGLTPQNLTNPLIRILIQSVSSIILTQSQNCFPPQTPRL